MRKLPAYTLIELMVTISIIGILASIAITQFGKARTQAEVGQTKVIVSDAGKSIEAFRAQEQTAGRIIVPIQGTQPYDTDFSMSGTPPSSSGASKYPNDDKYYSDLLDVFSGVESSNPALLGYGFKFNPQKIPNYTVYYGATPTPSTQGATLGSLEGSITVHNISYPKCYIFEASLGNNSFYVFRNGHIGTVVGTANCVTNL